MDLKVFKITFAGSGLDELQVVSDTLEAAARVAADAFPEKTIRWCSMERNCLLDERLVKAIGPISALTA